MMLSMCEGIMVSISYGIIFLPQLPRREEKNTISKENDYPILSNK